MIGALLVVFLRNPDRVVRGRRRTPYKHIVVPLLSSDEKFLVIGRLRAVL